MNIIKIYCLSLFFMLPLTSAYAQTTTTTVITPPSPTHWVSKNSSDNVTINNGTGNNLTITITVDKPIIPTGESRPSTAIPAGINLKNCGSTKHIDAGSSGICTTNDKDNPVTFSSDSPRDQVSGNYMINQTQQ